ncbi:unnamed protein product, partial [Amoebophrya sp. A120]
ANDVYDLNFVYVSNSDGNLIQLEKECAAVTDVAGRAEAEGELGENNNKHVVIDDDYNYTDSVSVAVSSVVAGKGKGAGTTSTDQETSTTAGKNAYNEDYLARKGAKTRKRKNRDRTQERAGGGGKKNFVVTAEEIEQDEIHVEQQEPAVVAPAKKDQDEKNDKGNTKTKASVYVARKRQACHWKPSTDSTSTHRMQPNLIRDSDKTSSVSVPHQLTISHKLLAKLSEKDAQCNMVRKMLTKYDLEKLDLSGFYPPCFFLPDN